MAYRQGGEEHSRQSKTGALNSREGRSMERRCCPPDGQRQHTEQDKGGGLQLESSRRVWLSAVPDPGTQGEAQIFQGYLFVDYIFPE